MQTEASTLEPEPSTRPVDDDARTVNGADRIVLAMVCSLFCVVMVRHAWVSDDGYITFRVVRNFVDGLGLRFNLVERVQAYTHPLWMFALAALALFSDDLYGASLVLSFICSVATLWVVTARLSPSRAAAAFAIALLVSSKSFMDFTSSGLENPLTYLLYACFLAHAFGSPLIWRKHGNRDGVRSFGWLVFIAALMAANRIDSLILALPVLALRAFVLRRRWRSLLRVSAIGAAPLIAWECFSVVYYGFLAPNTAFAKLGAGISGWKLAHQGFAYYLSQATFDPISIVIIAAAGAVVLAARERTSTAVLAGVALYLVYVVRIGGDFMAGRFFAAPVLGCSVLLSRALLASGAASGSGVVAVAAVLALGFAITPRPTLSSGSNYSVSVPPAEPPEDPRRVADERAYYFPSTGLLRLGRGSVPPLDDRIARGRAFPPARATLTGQIGAATFFAPPNAIVVDVHGLTDPLLARLPLQRDWPWRIGHLVRRVPDGYLETLETGSNRLKDPLLREFYDHLQPVISGPIWSWRRWREIFNFAVGRYEHLVNDDRHR